MPSFCLRGAQSDDEERPLRLAPAMIEVNTPWGPTKVKVWIGGRGFPIVVLHGLSANSRIYLLWLGFLARFVKVIAMDLPGHGDSEQLPRGQEFMGGCGVLLNCLLDSLGINYVAIIGHSLGARIACEATVRDPGRIVVLILVDAVTGDAWDRRMRNVRRMPFMLAPLAAEFLQDLGSLVANIRETDRSADLVRLGFDTYVGHVRHPMRSFVPATLSLINASPSVPLLEDIAKVGVATIVIWGDHDRLVTRESAESTAGITHGRLIVVGGAGHSWPLQNRDTARHILVHGLSDSGNPASLGNILGRVVENLAGMNHATATQSSLETSALYSHDGLAVALTPAEAYWEEGTPTAEPRVNWAYDYPSSRAG